MPSQTDSSTQNPRIVSPLISYRVMFLYWIAIGAVVALATFGFDMSNGMLLHLPAFGIVLGVFALVAVLKGLFQLDKDLTNEDLSKNVKIISCLFEVLSMLATCALVVAALMGFVSPPLVAIIAFAVESGKNLINSFSSEVSSSQSDHQAQRSLNSLVYFLVFAAMLGCIALALYTTVTNFVALAAPVLFGGVKLREYSGDPTIIVSAREGEEEGQEKPTVAQSRVAFGMDGVAEDKEGGFLPDYMRNPAPITFCVPPSMRKKAPITFCAPPAKSEVTSTVAPPPTTTKA